MPRRGGSWNGKRKGKNNPNWKGGSYSGLHGMVRTIRGRASQYKCVDCKNQAQEWSSISKLYKWNEKDFEPRCISCHRKNDNGKNYKMSKKHKIKISKALKKYYLTKKD